MRLNPMLMVDFYKIHHKPMYPDGMLKLYSNWTPRASRIPGVEEVVVFGIQHFIKEYLIDKFNKDFFGKRVWLPGGEELHEVSLNRKNKMIAEYSRHCNVDTQHIEDLWDLGYLPIEIKALQEGTLCPIGVPMLTITNTHPSFAWLVNYLESLLSCTLWQGMTSATIANEYKKILTKYTLLTDEKNTDFIAWQGHDFSMRGMSSVESAIFSGMGHLLSFTGTDNIPAIYTLERMYGAVGLIGASVPATEHSVMCMGGNNNNKNKKKLVDEKTALDHVQSFKEESPNLFKLAISIINGEVVEDKIYSSEHTDNQKSTYNYFKVENGEIVAIGEERTREGGWYWFKNHGKPEVSEAEDCDEFLTFRRLLKLYPTETLSVVSDTWNLWDVTTIYLPALKEEIMSREGKLVIRPDSGNPADILCGLKYEEVDVRDDVFFLDNPTVVYMKSEDLFYRVKKVPKGFAGDYEYTVVSTAEVKGLIQLLWETFEGTINEQGYKVLDSHIGAIYGDSITLARAEEICSRLMENGFATTNVVLGIGSYTYQYNTRDTFGFAMKATYGEVMKSDGNCTCENTSVCDCGTVDRREIWKDPVTDDGTKKSKRGLLRVEEVDDKLVCLESQTAYEETQGLLQTVFVDGVLHNETTLEEIREKLKSQFHVELKPD